MTVGELRKSLEGIDDQVEAIVRLCDLTSWRQVSSVRFTEDVPVYELDGNRIKVFVIDMEND